MKPIITFLFLTVLFLSNASFAKGSYAVTAPAAVNSNITADANRQEAKRILDRVREIQGMDKKALTRDQKRALRNELTDMKKRLADPGGLVVYLSGTAIVILIIILILLLI